MKAMRLNNQGAGHDWQPIMLFFTSLRYGPSTAEAIYQGPVKIDINNRGGEESH